MSDLFAMLRRVDVGRLAEWVVLAGVLAIAALISYTHLRAVWQAVAAPWAWIGPLTVDGLFAAAWLRMRRRRRQGQRVGALAYTTLLGALVVTVAGNVAAAFPAWVVDHRAYVAPVVYAWAAIAFAFVWELVTGHDRQVSPPAVATVAESVAQAGEDALRPVFVPLAAVAAATRSAQVTTLATPLPAHGGGLVETWEEKRARLLAEGAGRKRLARELAVSEHEARQWLASRGDPVAAS